MYFVCRREGRERENVEHAVMHESSIPCAVSGFSSVRCDVMSVRRSERTVSRVWDWEWEERVRDGEGNGDG